MSRVGRLVTAVRDNWYWGHTHGWVNLAEEHDVDPRVRVPRALRSAHWLIRHRPPRGAAGAAFLVGVQRSGTNMIVHGLDRAPELRVYNEGNRRAFADFQLRELDVVDDLVARSRRSVVLFKPLCDSDRIVDLLDRRRPGPPARAVWTFRDVHGRVRSDLLKFGDSNLDTFRALVRGTTPRSPWQLRGLSGRSVELVRALDVHRMSAATASALFWYVRNVQFFELGLDRRPDVQLAEYGAFLADPARAMRRTCAFLGVRYRPVLAAHITPQTRTRALSVEIDERVRVLCAGLEQRLRAAAAEQDRTGAQTDIGGR